MTPATVRAVRLEQDRLRDLFRHEARGIIAMQADTIFTHYVEPVFTEPPTAVMVAPPTRDNCWLLVEQTLSMDDEECTVYHVIITSLANGKFETAMSDMLLMFYEEDGLANLVPVIVPLLDVYTEVDACMCYDTRTGEWQLRPSPMVPGEGELHFSQSLRVVPMCEPEASATFVLK